MDMNLSRSESSIVNRSIKISLNWEFQFKNEYV